MSASPSLALPDPNPLPPIVFSDPIQVKYLPASLHDPVLAAPTAHALVADAQPVVHHALSGHGKGTYSFNFHIPVDVGPTYDLNGTADLAALGHVTVTGSISGVGFINQGHAGGRLTFSNAKGSVTIELTGPTQPGFSTLPEKYNYKVVGRTGAYAHLTDHGSLTLMFKAQPTGGQSLPLGTFTLSVPAGPLASNPATAHQPGHAPEHSGRWG